MSHTRYADLIKLACHSGDEVSRTFSKIKTWIKQDAMLNKLVLLIKECKVTLAVIPNPKAFSDDQLKSQLVDFLTSLSEECSTSSSSVKLLNDNIQKRNIPIFFAEPIVDLLQDSFKSICDDLIKSLNADKSWQTTVKALLQPDQSLSDYIVDFMHSYIQEVCCEWTQLKILEKKIDNKEIHLIQVMLNLVLRASSKIETQKTSDGEVCAFKSIEPKAICDDVIKFNVVVTQSIASKKYLTLLSFLSRIYQINTGLERIYLTYKNDEVKKLIDKLSAVINEHKDNLSSLLDNELSLDEQLSAIETKENLMVEAALKRLSSLIDKLEKKHRSLERKASNMLPVLTLPSNTSPRDESSPRPDASPRVKSAREKSPIPDKLMSELKDALTSEGGKSPSLQRKISVLTSSSSSATAAVAPSNEAPRSPAPGRSRAHTISTPQHLDVRLLSPTPSSRALSPSLVNRDSTADVQRSHSPLISELKMKIGEAPSPAASPRLSHRPSGMLMFDANTPKNDLITELKQLLSEYKDNEDANRYKQILPRAK